jgi:CCR4-NOT transcription complex subunit 2
MFYIFYNMPNDRAQILAASQLTDRGWVYVEEEMVWVKQSGNQFSRFNAYAWQEEPLV